MTTRLPVHSMLLHTPYAVKLKEGGSKYGADSKNLSEYGESRTFTSLRLCKSLRYKVSEGKLVSATVEDCLHVA